MTQQITTELRQWIIAQAQAGHSAESVLQSMKASGWDEDVAVDAMETTLRGHLDAKAVEQGLPPAVPVPEPDVGDSPLYLDGGDRQVAVLTVMASPEPEEQAVSRRAAPARAARAELERLKARVELDTTVRSFR